jgi:DNA-binding NarL/FixJ family response regulator
MFDSVEQVREGLGGHGYIADERLLAAGFSNQKTGEKLYISATTAEFHVSNIMRKLEVSRRAEAVYAASKRGLI